MLAYGIRIHFRSVNPYNCIQTSQNYSPEIRTVSLQLEMRELQEQLAALAGACTLLVELAREPVFTVGVVVGHEPS